jgi:hypothetical protein
MKSKDREAWSTKNKKLNEHIQIKVGMSVKDVNGDRGVVVKVIEPDSTTDGVVYVWQMDKKEYGGDNCEHYNFNFWKSMLRIIDDPYQALMEKIELEAQIDKPHDKNIKTEMKLKI